MFWELDFTEEYEMDDIMRLQNGSDIRGIACDGIEGENVNLTEDAGNLIGGSGSVMIPGSRRTACLLRRQKGSRHRGQGFTTVAWYRRLRCS